MFFLFILCGLLTMNTNILALNENFCVNCKHFIGVLGSDAKYGRCNLYPKITDNNDKWNYLVSGKRKVEYKFCHSMREDEEYCGESGKYFLKKKIPFPILKELVEYNLHIINNL